MVVRELVTKMGFKVDTKKLSTFESKIEGIKKKTAGATSRFGNFGKAVGDGIMKIDAGTLAFGAAAAAIAAVGKAISMATEKYLAFEQGMKGVERVTLATSEEMERMEKAALEAGEASIFTTADSANAMKFLAQAGLEVDEVITALPGALQLAAAANMDLATAADISTNILTSNKMKVEELTDVNNILAKTASKTNTDVIQLGWAFAELGNIGEMAGLKVYELSAFMGVLANNGIRGTSAGTTLKNAMIALLSPTKKGGELLSKLNIDMSQYIDASGKFKKGALPVVFGELNKAYKEGKVGIGALTKAFGKLPAKGIATFAATGREKLEELTLAFKNSGGTAEKAANVAFKGLSGALALLSSRIDVAMVKFMKTTRLNKVFEDIVRILSDVLPPLIDVIAVILKPIGVVLRLILIPIKLISAVLGGVIKLFARTGESVSNVLAPLDAIADYMDGIIESVRQFFSAFNKITIFERFYGLIKNIAKTFKGFFKNLTKSGSFAMKFFKIFYNVWRIIKSIGYYIGTKFIDLMRPVKDFWDLIIGHISKFFNWTISKVVNFFNWIGKGFQKLWSFIQKIVDAVVKPIEEVFNFISETIQEIADFLDIEVDDAKKPEKEIQKTISKETSKLEQKKNEFNVNAPVTVNGAGAGAAATGKAVREAVVSAFSIELQKIVAEAGGV